MVYKNEGVIIDTNIWVAAFNPDDSDHSKAQRILPGFLSYQIMPDLIFYETITVLKNKVDQDTVSKFVQFASDNRDIVIRLFYENNIDVLELVYDIRFTALSYADTLLLYLSKKYKILTFDKSLIKAIKLYGGECVLV